MQGVLQLSLAESQTPQGRAGSNQLGQERTPSPPPPGTLSSASQTLCMLLAYSHPSGGQGALLRRTLSLQHPSQSCPTGKCQLPEGQRRCSIQPCHDSAQGWEDRLQRGPCFHHAPGAELDAWQILSHCILPGTPGGRHQQPHLVGKAVEASRLSPLPKVTQAARGGTRKSSPGLGAGKGTSLIKQAGSPSSELLPTDEPSRPEGAAGGPLPADIWAGWGAGSPRPACESCSQPPVPEEAPSKVQAFATTGLSRHQRQAQAGRPRASPRPPMAGCDLMESQKARGIWGPGGRYVPQLKVCAR